MGVTAVLLCYCFSAREEFQISCSCPCTRVSLGCQNVLILVSSSGRRCKLPFFVSHSLIFLKGVAKLKNLQDKVSYVLVCAVEAWWAHNPQVLGSKPLEEQIPLEEINKIDNHAYANYPTKKGLNAQGAI